MSAARRAVSRVALVILLLTGLGALVPTPASATGPNTGDFVAAVNAARANAGRAPLTYSSSLSAVAYRWAEHMAATGDLAHNPSITAQVGSFRWVGENVGYGPDWRAVQNAFMASPMHRSNILDSDYTQLGIGVVHKGSRVWVTQVFKRPLTTHTTTARSRSTQHPVTTSRRTSPAAQPASHRTVRHQPSARELLSRRVATARSEARQHRNGDVLQTALGFAATMRTVGG